MNRTACATMALLALVSMDAHAARKPDQGQADFNLDAATDTGLLVVSMTMPRFSHGHLANLRWSLHFRQVHKGGKRASRKSITLEREHFITGRTIRTDFGRDIFGVVFAVDLPAGEYVLTRWHLDGNTTSLNIISKNARELPFDIRSGRATYVGNLDMKIGVGKNMLNMDVLADAGMVFSDQHERDILILLKKFPLVTIDQVDVHVTVDPSWQSLPGHTEKQVKPTPPIPSQ